MTSATRWSVSVPSDRHTTHGGVRPLLWVSSLFVFSGGVQVCNSERQTWIGRTMASASTWIPAPCFVERGLGRPSTTEECGKGQVSYRAGQSYGRGWASATAHDLPGPLKAWLNLCWPNQLKEPHGAPRYCVAGGYLSVWTSGGPSVPIVLRHVRFTRSHSGMTGSGSCT